jgi:hypothetical protein
MTEKTQHTPGPWLWTHEEDKPHRELIRANTLVGDYDSIAYHGADWPMKDEDAALIAAAPDMADTLKAILDYTDGDGNTLPHARLEAISRIARAAIAKAERSAGE